MQTCPNCGEENPDRFRICGICGTKLAPDEVVQEVRKTVSIVFSDLKGSTSLGERLDTEALREVLNVYFNEMRAVLERHGGTVEKYIGDAIMAVFGLPKLHEDDAMRAVRAAFEMKKTLEVVNERLERGWGVRLENRTGVNTGEVVAGDVSAGQRLVTGDAVNTAARLEQAAPALEILIGEPTYRLVRDAAEVQAVEPLELKGKAERVPAYQLLSVHETDDGVARRLDAPLVGRVEELATLQAALDRAEATRRPQLVTVFGPAGAGKSRLLREFVHRARGRAGALHGRCLSYGDGITFWPLAEVIREAALITDEDSMDEANAKLFVLAGAEGRDAAERVAAAIGLSDRTVPVQETFWGARKLAELLTRVRPLIVMIDDVHWAEDTFLDLLTYVLDEAEAPIVLVCSSRPDLLEEHEEWGVEREGTTRIVLRPLNEEESAQVVENLLGSRVDPTMRRRITDAAEGNPLFVEQMLSMLIDDGVLTKDDAGAWHLLTDAASITIPPSISALLTARLDKLGATDRSVIERSSVVGQVFFRGAVEELVADVIRTQVGDSLQRLTHKELIRPEATATFAAQDTFRFEHILIRDAAYHGQLKRTRADLHERLVDWLERVASDRVLEFEEIRGYHLEQAYLILAQLGPIDDHARGIGVRGADYLSSAGHRALARADMPAAANLLNRAAMLLPPDDADRPVLQIQAAEALIESGEFALADAIVTAAAETAAAIADASLQVRARLVALRLRLATETSDEASVVDEVETLIPKLTESSDHAALSRAWRLVTQVNFTAGRYGAAESAAIQMIEHARLAGDELLERRVMSSLAWCALYGPTPVEEAIARCEALIAESHGDRKVEAVTQCALAHLEAMRGRIDKARELYTKSRATLEELGWHLLAALTSIDSGPIEMLAGDPVSAEKELRRDFETLSRMGDTNYLSTTTGFLAEALYQQDRFSDALEFASITEREAAADDVAPQVLWRSVRGKVEARSGALEEGEALVREALTLVGDSDEPDARGNVLLDVADVVSRTGRFAEAAALAGEAAEIFEAKGNLVSAERARRLAEDCMRSKGALR